MSGFSYSFLREAVRKLNMVARCICVSGFALYHLIHQLPIASCLHACAPEFMCVRVLSLCVGVWATCNRLYTRERMRKKSLACVSPSLNLLLQDAPLSDCMDCIDGPDVSEGASSPAKSFRKVLPVPVVTSSQCAPIPPPASS